MSVKITSSIVIYVLAVLVLSGCGRVKPELQDEYMRSGLSTGWQDFTEKQKQIIPTAMTEAKIPGLAVAVVDREGIVWGAGYGYTDYDCRIPITTNTNFSIQSISKAVTSVIVLCAVQDGIVELDVPITKYIPDFTVNSIFEDTPQDKITLRHLLTHRAGFIHEAPVGNNNEPECPSFDAHIKSISRTWLKCRVGSEWNYSNIGMDLAVYIVESQIGEPYSEYLARRLFMPLGMNNTTVDMRKIQNDSKRAMGHIPHIQNINEHVIPMTGAGGVYTSVNDFSHFVEMFINDRYNAINRDYLEEINSGQSVTVGNKTGIQGLGIIYRNDGRNKLYKEGSGLSGPFWGGGFGYNTYTAWSYDYGVGVMVFTNMIEHNRNETIALDIFHELIDKGLVDKGNIANKLKWSTVPSLADDGKEAASKIDLKAFSRYRPEWKKYLGTYTYKTSWKMDIIGSTENDTFAPRLVVAEKNGYLEINSKRLDEIKPDIFVTESGQCLDFSGDTAIWNGLRIKKK